MDESKRLRALLDERCIEWKDNDTPINGVTSYMTMWHCTNGKLVSFIETEIPHATKLRIYNPTPEQAIAATVGVGTCKDVCASVSEFTCSKCGFNCDLMSWISLFDGDDGRHRHHHHGTPNYCPNCGRRCIEEVTE